MGSADSPAAASPAWSLRSPWPWLGLGLGLVLTVVTWGLLQRVERARLEVQHQAQGAALARDLAGWMKGLEQVLHGAAGFLGRGELPSRTEWHQYSDSLDLDSTYPGFQGLGFAEWIPQGGLEAHTQRLRRGGFPDYRVQPGGSLPPLSEGLSAIIYLEPMDNRNLRAFGKDMLAETTRRTAMLRARDTGQLTLSGPVTLYQETAADIQTGTLLYAPVYDLTRSLNTVAERRQAFRGWAYIPFRMTDLVSTALQRRLRTVDLALFDVTESGDPALLFESRREVAKKDPVGATVRTFEIAGRQWQTRAYPNPTFLVEAGGRKHLEIIAGGMVASLLLFAALAMLQGAETRARMQARLKGEELEATEAQFQALFERAPFGMAIMDSSSGRFLSVNSELGRILGYSTTDLLKRDFQSLTHPDHLQSDLASVRELAAGLLPFIHKEKRYLHQDGHEVWARLSMVNLPALAEGARRHLSIVEEITELRQKQEALRASEELFRSLFEVLPIGVTLTDDQGHIVACNPASEALLGIPSDEHLRREFKGPYWDIIRADGSPMPQEEYPGVRAMAEGRRIEDVEMGVRRPDGQISWILVSAEPMRIAGLGVLIVYRDISDRRRYEQGLIEREADLALAQEIGEFGSWTLYMEEGEERWVVSDGLRRIYGYAPDHPITMQTGFDLMHPEDRASVQRAWSEALAGTGAHGWEHRIIVRGEVRWLDVRVEPYLTPEGRLRQVSGIVQDITPRKAAEEALCASEARLRFLGDQLPDSFLYQYVVRPGEPTRFLYLSAGVERLCGVKVESVIQNPAVLLDQIDPAMLPAYREAEAISARDLTPFAMDLRQKRADECWRWFRVRSMPRRQPDGSVVWEGISTDVTEFHAARIQLEESEARFRGVVDNAVDAIYVHDETGRILMCNPAACRMTGYSQEEILGFKVSDIDLDSSPRRDFALWSGLPEVGQARLETRHRRKDGSSVLVEVNLGLFEGGPQKQYLALVRDLSTREQIKETELRAQKAESLVLMAGSIAHDFNNIFQGVNGFLEIAAMKARDHTELRLVLGKAESSLRRAIELSWKMLDFSGQAFLKLERLDLEAWLPGLVARLQQERSESAVFDVTSGTTPWVLADGGRLEEVVQALVANACEAGEPGPARISLRLLTEFGSDVVEAGAPGCWPLARPHVPATVCLELSDEGPGIPPEILDRVCDPFFGTRALGRGLGLASVVGILRAHHAGLHLFNREQGGLVARIHFPPGGA